MIFEITSVDLAVKTLILNIIEEGTEMPRKKLIWLLAGTCVAIVVAFTFFYLPSNQSHPKRLAPLMKTPGAPARPESAAKHNSPAPTPVKVVLYFADNQAIYLLPEERRIVPGSETLPKAVVQALIAGPRLPGRTRTIPEGTKLLSLKVTGGTAIVNFSRELKTKHWGGSAGELMTVYSVVNSLARLPGISRVQFLLEGERIESLTGHMDLTQPLTPRWDLVKL
ncbi:GerMN domain-containing protein [Thermodesulfitimonas sp.]